MCSESCRGMCWEREFRLGIPGLGHGFGLRIPGLGLGFTKPHRNFEIPGWEFDINGNFGISVLPELPKVLLENLGTPGNPGMGWDEGTLNPIQGRFQYPRFPKPLPSFPKPLSMSRFPDLSQIS